MITFDEVFIFLLAGAGAVGFGGLLRPYFSGVFVPVVAYVVGFVAGVGALASVLQRIKP